METTTVKQAPAKERKVKGMVEIEISKCKGCELCRTACKENALTLSDTINIKGYRYIIANNDLCTGCVNCALVCPDAIITVYRTNPKKGGKKENITPDNIKDEIKAIITSPVYNDLSNMDYI
jgi:2-oxoglutarate ferredoxin oxidoreductase subunit delta